MNIPKNQSLIFWANGRLQRLCVALLLAVLAAVVFKVITDKAYTSILYVGDFPGFYAPAVIVDRGLGGSLYDVNLQRSIENEFWPHFNGEYLFSSYPPYVSVLLWPLACFSPLTAKILFGLLCLLGTIFAVHFTRKFSSSQRGDFFVELTLLLVMPPIAISILGGQNTGISLFLIAAAALAWRNGLDFLSGAALGCLLYKPQFAIFYLPPLLLVGKIRVLGGFFLVAALFFLLGAGVQGVEWPMKWIEATMGFAPQNYNFNGSKMISLPALGQFISRYLPSALGSLVTALTTLLCVILYLFSCKKLFWDTRHDINASAAGLLIFAIVAVMISPQTLFYDLGIALLSLVLLWPATTDQTVWNWLKVALFSAIGYWVMVEFGWPVLSFIGIALLILASRRSTKIS